MNIFAIPAFSRALLALIASGLAFPAIGTIILGLEMIPARFAVMHVALLGAAVGMLLGIDLTLAALLASLLAAVLVARLGESSRARGASDVGSSAGGALGLVMIVSLALAFILFYKTDVNAIEAFSIFWGNILALDKSELILVACAAIVIPGLLLVFLKPVMAVLYDRELAAASGHPARLVYYGLVVAACLGIGIAMRLTGALLADATTLLPALAARNLKKSFPATLLLGACFGLASNLGGFALALAWDIPISPGIILVGAMFTALTALKGRYRRKPSDRGFL